MTPQTHEKLSNAARRTWADPVIHEKRSAAIKRGHAKNPKSRTTRSHCRRGHEITYKNTVIGHNGYFRCRICMYARISEYKARKRLQCT